MRAAVAAAFGALAALGGCATAKVHEYRRIVMGAECRILVAADEASADRAAAAAFRRLAEVEESLSDWIPSSEVRRLPARGLEADSEERRGACGGLRPEYSRRAPSALPTWPPISHLPLSHAFWPHLFVCMGGLQPTRSSRRSVNHKNSSGG